MGGGGGGGECRGKFHISKTSFIFLSHICQFQSHTIEFILASLILTSIILVSLILASQSHTSELNVCTPPFMIIFLSNEIIFIPYSF